MRSYLVCGFVLFSLFVAGPSITVAQDSVLAELYGHGVHAYFAGQHRDAHQYLTTAIEQGSRDPRVFYFRGLAYMSLGRPDESRADFQKGADLETRGADRVYPVSHSLQRIQGSLRMDVEQYRQQARLAARTRNVKASQARYEQLQSSEEQVLRNPNRPAPPAKASDLLGTPPAQDTTDPFGGDALAVEPEAVPVPAAEESPEAAADLFGDTPAMPAEPADTTADPFADDTPSAAPAEDMPAEVSDPFADPFQ